ncbi:MAG TPA: SdpI family protein [Egibacteraceae bacterium]|nr:SdpI family protein [Egibacteraceae bacterium]
MSGEPGFWVLALTLLLAGMALIVVGRKQKAGTLPRNWVAGLRTWETMRNDDAWHAAHTATAGMVTGAGVVQVIAGAALVVLQPSEEVLLAIVLGGAGLTLALVLAAGVRGHRLAARMNRGHDPPSE